MNTLQRTTAFAEWLERLADLKARARILARLNAASAGNFGDWAPVGDGVNELRVDFGPGYRVYYMREGAVVYLLLCGGDKSTQRADITRAHALARVVRAHRAEGETPSPQAKQKSARKAKKG